MREATRPRSTRALRRSARSPPAAPARALVAWREAVGGRARRPASAARRTGRARSPASATRARASCSSASRPAKDGGNRTGRVFTGDRSGDFLFAALHRAGLANQPTSIRRDDGLELHGAYVAAAVRCAPPDNKPLPDERDRCAPYLHRELALLARAARDRGPRRLRLGRRRCGRSRPRSGALPRPLPRFGHGAEAPAGPYALLGTYHPSQQNTFTGRLTPAMLDAVLRRARALS